MQHNEGGRTREEGGRASARRPIRSFRDLEVCQLAQGVMVHVHKLVLTFPEHERYGLVDQMRRASKSVAGLIAEGWGLHASTKEFKNYLRRSRGSANEMEAHLDSAKALGYGPSDEVNSLIVAYGVLAAKHYRLAENWQTFDRPPSSLRPPPSTPNSKRGSQ